MRLVVRSGTNLGRSSSAQLLLASKLRNLEPVGEGNREGADVFTRLTSLASKGSADLVITQANASPPNPLPRGF